MARESVATEENGLEGGPGKRRVPQTDYPRHTLAAAVRVARVLSDHYGGQPAEPIDVAASLGVQPTTGHFRTLTGAAIAYGLTSGGGQAGQISLTPLGQRLVMPTEEGDSEAAIREALVEPRIFREFLERFDGKKLPPKDIARNIVIKSGVPADDAEKAIDILLQSAEDANVLQEINSQTFVRLRGATTASVTQPGLPEQSDSPPRDGLEPSEVALLDASPPSQPSIMSKPIFVGHGKKKAPRDKVLKILEQFKIPFKVAQVEPNLGRPIPKKVKDVMAECGSAILIFTKDEEFLDPEGNEVWRPSENVVYELGAASFAYDDRIVIFMEEGLSFPTNFESVGHITFREGAIDANTTDLLKELVGFGLVKITPA